MIVTGTNLIFGILAIEVNDPFQWASRSFIFKNGDVLEIPDELRFSSAVTDAVARGLITISLENADKAAQKDLPPAVTSTLAYVAQSGSNSTHLFKVDLQRGLFLADLGPVMVGSNPVALTGLAIDPTNGDLYGSTSEQSPNNFRSLIKINPITCAATLIGTLPNADASDIAFDAIGQLYGSRSGNFKIYKLDKALVASDGTGVTQFADATSVLSAIQGKGLDFDLNGDLWYEDSVRLVKIDGGNGSIITTTPTSIGSSPDTDFFGPSFSLSSFNNGDHIGAIKFDSNGILYGTITNRDRNSGEHPLRRNYYIINTDTGLLTPKSFDFAGLADDTSFNWDAFAIIR